MQDISFIHQVFINDNRDIPEKIADSIEYNTNSLIHHFPHAVYKLWSGEEIRDFIATYFSRNVVDAYDLLRPYAYKCDLARYCILKIYGGLYADLAIRIVDHLELPD